MSAPHQALLAASGTVTDPSFSSVVLLCHFDGTNGQTTFTDNSNSAHTLTATTATVSTTTPKFGTGSADFTGAGSRITVGGGSIADFQFGAGKFTVEAWAYFTSFNAANTYGFITQFGSSANLGWFFGNVSGSLAFYYSTTSTDVLNVGAVYTPTLNAWVHYAADRDASNVLRVYADGAVVASATVSATIFPSTQAAMLGNDNNTTRSPFGRQDDSRVTKGVTRYGGAFTPPTAAFPNS